MLVWHWHIIPLALSMGSHFHEALEECGLEGADLAISAFSAALLHYKRASVALPWPPSESFSTNSPDCKDFEAARLAIDALPPLHGLVHQLQAGKVQPIDQDGIRGPSSSPSSSQPPTALGPSSSRLLDWLISPSAAGRRCPRSLRRIGPETFLRQVGKVMGYGVNESWIR